MLNEGKDIRVGTSDSRCSLYNYTSLLLRDFFLFYSVCMCCIRLDVGMLLESAENLSSK